MSSDFKKSNKQLKSVLVVVSETVSTSLLDAIIKDIETSATQVSSDTLMAVAGRESSKQLDEKLLTLAQLQSTDSTTIAAATTAVPGIATYLYPNLLIGILFMLFILSILIFSFLLLMDVQTPTVFSTENIDFGKIEK